VRIVLDTNILARANPRSAGPARALLVLIRDSDDHTLVLSPYLLEELEIALDELPEQQREVFIAHELEGRSFKELSAESGVNVNTLLSRKRYAVLHLRERLQSIHDEFMRK